MPRNFIRRAFQLLAAAAALALAISAPVPAAGAPTGAPTFTVNSLFDAAADPLDTNYSVCRTAAANATCTLRAAIMKANHFAGGGVTILIPAGAYTLTIDPAGANDELTGDLNLTQSMDLAGDSAATTFVDGNGHDRVFHIAAGVIVTIQSLTIRNGYADFGGGVRSEGQLTLANSTVTGNTGTGGGGGLASAGSLTLTGSRVTANQTTASLANGGGLYLAGLNTIQGSLIDENHGGRGGGLLIDTGATLSLNDSTVSGNQSASPGGGFYNYGTTTVNNSTLNANLSTNSAGGGIANEGTLVLNNSTLSANSAASRGGAIWNYSLANLFHVTIAGNLSDSKTTGEVDKRGGGIYTSAATGATHLWNTLLAENYADFNNSYGSDCSGPVVSHDYNYVQVVAGCTVSGTTDHFPFGGEAGLAALADFGGPTFTRALLPGSPALDQIPNGLCRDSFATEPVPDQRGAGRPVGGLCDMGAFEGVYDPGLYFRNLVRNGDAESGGASPTGAYVGTPHWEVTEGTFTAAPYDLSFFPYTLTQTVPADHGYSFFAGGPDSPSSSSSQTIDLAAIAGDIDAGQVLYTFSADLGGDRDQEDFAAVYAFFQDEAVIQIDSASIGPVTADDRGDLTGLLPVSTNGTVPAGTRSILIEVNMQGAGYNNGYADNISLVLRPDLSYLFLPFLAR